MAKKSEYDKLRKDVEKPMSKRSDIETSRGNVRTPRRYHLTKDKMDKLLAGHQEDGSFPNPYRKGGIYFALVEALANLGPNAQHTFKEVKKEIEKILRKFKTKDDKNAWEAFRDKSPVNEHSAKDVNGRIMQNAMVLQRITGRHPYGEKLRQLSACIDIIKQDTGLPVLVLNTNNASPDDVAPINEMRRSRAKKVEQPATSPPVEDSTEDASTKTSSPDAVIEKVETPSAEVETLSTSSETDTTV